MKQKYILFLLAALILIAAGAKFLRNNNNEIKEEFFLPRGIQIEDVAKISISSQGKSVIIVHDKNWTIGEKAVDENEIILFIADLYNAKIHELPAIPLEALSLTSESGATTIILSDSHDNTIASAVLGNIILSSDENATPIARYALKNNKPVVLNTPLIQADYPVEKWQ